MNESDDRSILDVVFSYVKKLSLFVVVVMFLLIISNIAMADPVGTGTITPGATSRGSNPGAGTVVIQGGNVTSLGTIISESITSKWAGFYGTLTGSITLENAAGAVFYNWTQADPEGKVYATRESSTPTWASIDCATLGQVSAEGTTLGLASGADNITNTYCETCGNHSAFAVGSASFAESECAYRTNAFNQAGPQSADWDQILLYEGSHVVYTAIISQNTTGFDGGEYDFQLLVGENASDAATTSMYFYVEI
jgi:hypothetical protein